MATFAPNIRIDGSILSGKIVLLTGAGGGIGLEAAKAFAEMGVKVLIAEIDREKGEKAAEDIKVKFPGAAFFLHTDLSDETAVRKMRRYTCPVRLSGYYIQQRCSRHYRKNRRSEYRGLGLVLCGKPESPGHADILFPRNDERKGQRE